MSPVDLIVPTAVLAVAAVCRRIPVPSFDGVERLLSGRGAPVVLGVVSALVVWFVWGSMQQMGVWHDERAYRLQAEIFAGGRWVAPGLPLPAFFEQAHVLVTPLLASKYPPGHSLLLTPGVWLGLPGLMSLVQTGIAGGLLFALGRRVTNPWLALIAWLLWTTADDNLRWRASYYSEVTTSAMVLLAWWSAWLWRGSNRRAWLVLLAAAVGWGAITRPLTMLAFTLPLGVLVLRDLIRTRGWRDLPAPLAVTIVILAIVPVWSRATVGSWRETPLGVYTRTYLPWDKMGFGLDSSAPTRALPAELQRVADQFIQTHERHTIASIPGQLAGRVANVINGTWRGWRFGLILFAVVGLLSMPAALTFAFGSGVLLVLAYLVYAHPSEWTVYYLEFLPVLAMITALGIWRAISFVQLHSGPMANARPAQAILATLLLVVLSAKYLVADVRATRQQASNTGFLQQRFEDAVSSLPAEKLIVFVRHAPNYVGHFSLVRNEPDLNAARSWIVYDRGAENEALLRLAPGRTAYLFDQRSRTLAPISAAPVR